MADGYIKIDTTIDTKNLNSQLGEIKDGIDKTGQEAGKSLEEMGKQFAAVAASAATVVTIIKNIAQSLEELSARADRVDKLSQSLGLTRETFQELDYAFEQNGASLEGFTTGMRTLQGVVTKAAGGASTAFDKLGVSVKNLDGSMKSQDQILKETLAAFNGLDSGVEKSTLAQEVFGRSAQELMPLLNQEAGTVDSLRERAHELGLVLGDEAVDAGVAFGDALNDLKKTYSAANQAIFAPLVKVLTEVILKITDVIAWFNSGSKAAAVLRNIILAVTVAVAGLLTTLVVIPGIITAITAAVKLLTAAIAANPIGAIVTVLLAVLIPAILAVYNNWDKIYSWIKEEIQILGAQFKIFGSMIKEVFVVAFNGAKAAAISFAKLLMGNILDAIVKFLEFCGKIPLVGDKFLTAAAAVEDFSDGLEEAATEAESASRAAIKAAQAEQDAVEEEQKKKLEGFRAEREARRAASREAERQAKQAEKNAEALEDEAYATERVIETKTRYAAATQTEADKIEEVRAKYKNTMQVLNAKMKDGAISSEEFAADTRKALESLINSLYELGYTANEAGSDGDKMLAHYLKALQKLDKRAEPVVKKMTLGEKIAQRIAEGIARDGGGSVEEALKQVLNAGSKIKEITAGAAKIGGKIVQGIKKGIQTAAKGLSFFATFDLANISEQFDTFIAGLVDFFTNDIANLPAFVDAGMDTIINFVSGMVQNLPEILRNVQTVLRKVAMHIAENAPVIIAGILSMLPDILRALIEMIPDIVVAVCKAIPAIIAALIAALPDIVTALLLAIPTMIDALVRGLWELIKGLGLTLGEAFLSGLFGIVDKIKEWAGNIGSTIGGWFKKLKFWASGTDNAPAGYAVVGEEGPELVRLAGGEKIYNAQETRGILNGSGLASLSAGFTPQLAAATAGGGSLSLNISPTTVEVDGATIARVTWERLDHMAGRL